MNFFKKIIWAILMAMAMIIGFLSFSIFFILTYIAFALFAVAGHIEESMIREETDKDLLEDI